MAWPKGKARKSASLPVVGDDLKKSAPELKEGIVPEPVVVIKNKCAHSAEHHDPEKKWCNSCGCMKFNGCGPDEEVSH